jgi:2,3-diaminopropionate biosynthesis protein SbnB
MLMIRSAEVADILAGRETDLIDIVRDAYILHERGQSSSVPHSTFLRFPGDQQNRIIGLPAYLGGDDPVCGMKWVASFPGNLAIGLQRATATILLNSVRTGRLNAVIEGSLISAKRTAASAALAARLLAGEQPDGVTLVGCGVINLEVLCFLRAALPTITQVMLFDRDRNRALEFARRCEEADSDVSVQVADDAAHAAAAHGLICFATTALQPHTHLSACRPGTTVLHVSLRDVFPEAILRCQNVVDDPDHVCREGTSLHLAEQLTGNRGFIAASIGAILSAPETFHRDADSIRVFSPFGLGILDLAVARFVWRAAKQGGLGVEFHDFQPGLDVEPAAAQASAGSTVMPGVETYIRD